MGAKSSSRLIWLALFLALPLLHQLALPTIMKSIATAIGPIAESFDRGIAYLSDGTSVPIGTSFTSFGGIRVVGIQSVVTSMLAGVFGGAIAGMLFALRNLVDRDFGWLVAMWAAFIASFVDVPYLLNAPAALKYTGLGDYLLQLSWRGVVTFIPYMACFWVFQICSGSLSRRMMWSGTAGAIATTAIWAFTANQWDNLDRILRLQIVLAATLGVTALISWACRSEDQTSITSAAGTPRPHIGANVVMVLLFAAAAASLWGIIELGEARELRIPHTYIGNNGAVTLRSMLTVPYICAAVLAVLWLLLVRRPRVAPYAVISIVLFCVAVTMNAVAALNLVSAPMGSIRLVGLVGLFSIALLSLSFIVWAAAHIQTFKEKRATPAPD